MPSLDFLKINDRAQEAQQSQSSKEAAQAPQDQQIPFAELIFTGSGSAEDKNAFAIYRRENSDHFLSLQV